MCKKTYFLALILTLFSGAAMAQDIIGVVSDASTGETLIEATVLVKNGSTQAGFTVTDFDGNYRVSGLTPGSYTVEFSFVGMKTKTINNVTVQSTKITTLNVALSSDADLLVEVDLVGEYQAPLIEREVQGKTFDKATIKSNPSRSINGLAGQSSGVNQSDNGDGFNVNGGRSGEVTTFIDGVKVTGSTALNNSALDNVQLITGGVPAEYGDAASGIISITTRGPSSNSFGGIELQTSKFLDPFNYNLLEFYASTPLVFKKDANGEVTKDPLLGVFVSGNGTFVRDASYARFSSRLSEDVRSEILTNPIDLAGSASSPSSTRALEDINPGDIEDIRTAENTESQSVNAQIKFDLVPTDGTNLKFGGNFFANRDRGTYDGLTGRWYNNRLLNTELNPYNKRLQYRLFATFSQYFDNKDGEEEGESTFRNARYSLHADYSYNSFDREHPVHGDDIYKYNYVGKFTPIQSTESDGSFAIGDRITFDNLVTGEEETVNITTDPSTGNANFVSVRNTGVERWLFEGSDVNPLLTAYNDAYFSYANEDGEASLDLIRTGGGLRNGDNPDRVYSLFTSPGEFSYNNFQSEDNQFRFTGNAGGQIGIHTLKVGFEFERRTYRQWQASSSSIWSTSRLLENRHLTSASDVNYTFDGTVNDDNSLVLTAVPVVDENALTGYARNLRDRLGVSYSDAVFTDAQDLSDLSLDLFSDEELHFFGVTSAYGFTPGGERITGNQPTFDDFLNDSLQDGTLTRQISAFQPIYMAGYIQDKIVINDIILSLGLRVDRYDANQSVLEDPFIIFDNLRAGDVDYDQFSGFERPSNINDDFAVYVDDPNNPTQINGFRDGRIWYDAQGNQVSNPLEIAGTSGRVEPYLAEGAQSGLTDNGGLTDAAFKDYTPSIIVMPRLSFNFNLSEDALFYAYYDVLTQRPGVFNSRFDADLYRSLAISQNTGTFNSNPDLRPQRNTDYEIGFKKALNDNSALTFGLKYREIRDQIQLTNFFQAYPNTYSAYDNFDFSTVKQLSITYELRPSRISNLRLSTSYTLQYADGTGSSTEFAENLVRANLPNLRQTVPLSFENRHSLKAQASYGYENGERYNGPESLKKILGGMNIALTWQGLTGNPYTAQAVPVSQVTVGVNNTNQVLGSVNGVRMPFNSRIDIKLDKEFAWQSKGKDGNMKDRSLTVYLQVQNVLNTQNVLNVYGFTGNTNDDGFLNSNIGAEFASNQLNELAFRSLYNDKVDNPFFLSRPRTIRLGVLVPLN